MRRRRARRHAELLSLKAAEVQTETERLLAESDDVLRRIRASNLDHVLDAIETRFGGAAEAASKTPEGRQRGLAAELADRLEQITRFASRSSADAP